MPHFSRHLREVGLFTYVGTTPRLSVELSSTVRLVKPQLLDPPMPKDPPVGKLPKEEQRDDAGQFVGKRVGRARARMREEQSDDRSPAKAPAASTAIHTRIQKKTGRPKAACLIFTKAET